MVYSFQYKLYDLIQDHNNFTLNVTLGVLQALLETHSLILHPAAIHKENCIRIFFYNELVKIT